MQTTEPTLQVTVHSKPSCVQCNAIYRALDKHVGADSYAVLDISVDDTALANVKAFGYLQAPVTIAEFMGQKYHFSGFRPDKLDKLMPLMKAHASGDDISAEFALLVAEQNTEKAVEAVSIDSKRETVAA